MTPILHQSFLSGTLNRLPIRGLLDATLDGQALRLSSPVSEAIIPIASIQTVKLIRNIVEFGIRITYHDASGLHITGFRTRKYKAWGAAFRQLGITVIPPKGWFSDFL
jgi:hypothetical protein